MGAADIVPGVSGGTIAFITGIYFRLLAAINAVPAAVAAHLVRGQLRRFWDRCDGGFLLCLLAGVVTSIVTLASAISFALTSWPIYIWSFFFGLILASVWHLARQLPALSWALLAPLVCGTLFSWWVSTLPVGAANPTDWVFFGAGALAICAMILPGISGSFILLTLGMYAPVLAAVKELQLGSLALFVAGCVTGLLSFAKLLTWAIQRHHDAILALLTGFMIGALNKVWPWKQVLSWRTNSSGAQVPLQEVSITPMHYAELTGLSSHWLLALLFVMSGFLVVLLVEWLGKGQVATADPHNV
ncbi:DUF368 domain-containing protein [Marinobacter sp. X15-166B]|uniref:DUF368 domain-containing protein n=1 Tax=Marinobacter sp. X15-166B TaxID=1897620 RepID=UPI0009F1B764|nr:DUF368 domain-containing protein [Marinobacter sp. X15-166B]